MSFKRQERLRDTVTKSCIHLGSTKKLPIKLSDKLFVPKSWHCLPTFNTENEVRLRKIAVGERKINISRHIYWKCLFVRSSNSYIIYRNCALFVLSL